jgi:hypothetical protein
MEQAEEALNGLPPLFEKAAQSADVAAESAVNYSQVLKQLVDVSAEMEASMARMEKGAGALGAQLAEAELRLSQLSQEFAQSGDADVFKEIEKTAKEILSLRQQTAREEEKIRKETTETSAEYRKQAELQARAIVSIEEEVNLLEAKLSGNKDLMAELQRQQDFNEAREKTGRSDVGLADRLAELRAEERRREEEEAGQRTSRGGVSRIDPTTNQRIGALRGDFRAREAEERAAALANRNMFRSATAAEDRADRRRDSAMQSARMRDTFEKQFGASNLGEAYREYQNETPFGQRLTQDQFKQFYQDMAKTPEERRREEEAARGKDSAGGKPTDDPMQGIRSAVRDLKTYIVDGDRLPQHAMS